MSTVDKQFAEMIIKHNGFASAQDKADYEADGGYNGGDNPRCVRIVEYTNAWGNKAYGITFENETPERQARYLVQSPTIQDPKVIWAYQAPGVSAVTGAVTGRYSSTKPQVEEIARNMEGRQMVRSEDRAGAVFDLTMPFRLSIQVAQDGVSLNFYPTGGEFPQGLTVNVDAIGPQIKDSLIRKGLDQWVKDMEAFVKVLESQASSAAPGHGVYEVH